MKQFDSSGRLDLLLVSILTGSGEPVKRGAGGPLDLPPHRFNPHRLRRTGEANSKYHPFVDLTVSILTGSGEPVKLIG